MAVDKVVAGTDLLALKRALGKPSATAEAIAVRKVVAALSRNCKRSPPLIETSLCVARAVAEVTLTSPVAPYSQGNHEAGLAGLAKIGLFRLVVADGSHGADGGAHCEVQRNAFAGGAIHGEHGAWGPFVDDGAGVTAIEPKPVPLRQPACGNG